MKNALFSLALIFVLAIFLPFTISACLGGGSPPVIQPTPPPPDVPPNNGTVCVPPDLVTDCWHKPPGSDWTYIPPSTNPPPPPVDPPPPPTDNLCHAPGPYGPWWGDKLENVQAQRTRQAVEDAKQTLGNRCGHDPLETIALLADILRSRGFCSSGPWDDALVIGAPSNLWEEYHVVPFHPEGHEYYGCYTQNPYKGSWILEGHVDNWPESSTCGIPSPPSGESERRFKVFKHNQGLNMTYVVYGKEYCADIGYTDNRQWCPVRLEGNPQRGACEIQAYGVPVWTEILGGNNCREDSNPHLLKCKNGQLPTSATICSEDGSLCKTWTR